MFHPCEVDTILSFIMKHEIPDNLINMCCISLSVAVFVSRKSPAFVWGLPGSQEVIAVGQWGTLIPWRGGLPEDISRFDQGLLMDPPEKGKWGSYQSTMTRGQFWCPFSLIAVLLFQDQNLVEQPGKIALHPEMEFRWRLRWSKWLLS